MNPESRLAEAAKQLSLVAEDADLTTIQRETAQHLAGLTEALGKSIVRLDASDGELRADGGQIEACPECDWADINRRHPGEKGSPLPPTADRYLCEGCGATFDEPVVRPPKASGSALARKLAEADPDEAIPDGGQIQRDDDEGEWFECVCGARYRSRKPALQCCSDRLAPTTPDEHGSPTFIADGGAPTDRDPADDPRACSKCGVHIGLWTGEYCDPCARDLGEKPPIQRCLHCGQRAPQELMDTLDVSADDEYYPEIRYLCRNCSEGDDGA